MLNIKIYKKIISILSFFIFPFVALAQVTLGSGGGSTPSTFSGIVCIIAKLCLDAIPFIIVIAVGAFIYGLIKYVGSGDNEEMRTEGTKMMVYGIIGFFFIVSIWGIISLITNTFSLGNVGIPQFQNTGSSAGCSGVTS